MTATAVLQMHDRETFERNVTRSLVAGGIAGAVHVLAWRLGHGLGFGGLPFPAAEGAQFVPLGLLAIIGATLACVRGDRWDRVLLSGMAIALPIAPWFMGLGAGWNLAVGGACAGALMVRSQLCERGEEGQVAVGRPGLLHYVLGAGLCGGLAVIGNEVARVLAIRLADFSTPVLFAGIASAVTVSLFVALGSIAAHLALSPDPVEARCEELIPQLHGDLRGLAERALSLYRQCGQALAALPREPAREEMARTLSRMTKDAVELASEWSGLEAHLEDSAVKELAAEQADLAKSAKEARDPVARRQLELAAAALREEMDRLDELRLRRERIVAKLKVEVALLDGARVALIGMRSGQVQIKAAALSAFARKFSALSAAQSDEAKLADEAATVADLAQHEVPATPRVKA